MAKANWVKVNPSSGSGTVLSHPLSALVGLYVELA